MPRLKFSLSSTCIALFVPIVGLHGQSPTSPAIPDTPAGRVLRAYLDVNPIGGLDTALLRLWVQRYRPGVVVDMNPVRAE